MPFLLSLFIDLIRTFFRSVYPSSSLTSKVEIKTFYLDDFPRNAANFYSDRFRIHIEITWILG